MERSLADLTDDLVVEILSRLPVKSICRFKCVSRHWRDLITHPANRKKLPQTLFGFFHFNQWHDVIPQFVSLYRNEMLPVSEPPLSFLTGYEAIYPQDSCNGLLLCLCWKVSTDKEEYVVCNPATEQWLILPDSGGDDHGHESQICLGFDPAVSPHFHVFSILNDVQLNFTGVNIYSSEAGSWCHKKNGWAEDTTLHQRGVFLNGMIHFISLQSTIVAVDIQGGTWRTIPLTETMFAQNNLSSNAVFMDQSQGHLYYLNLTQNNISMFSIWILENYLGDEWVFKYNIDTSRLFGFRGAIMGLEFTFIAIHPECNLIFFNLYKDAMLQAYDIDRDKVHIIEDHSNSFRSKWYTYLPYAPLFRVIG